MSLTSQMRNITLVDFLKINSLKIIFIGSLLLLVMLALIIIAIATNRIKRIVLQNSEAALRNAAYVDTLTGLSTMLKFEIDAAALLKTAAPKEYSILALDIDNFKYINDVLGYEAGNHVLQLLASQFNKFKQSNTIISRMNADNFIFMYRTEEHRRLEFGEYTPSFISDTFTPLLGSDYNLRFSLGLYTVTDPTAAISFMVDCACIAKKSAKSLYTNSIVEYTKSMDEQISRNRTITLSMEHALQDGEFVPYLQPKYLLNSETICGAEVLVRWITGEHSLIMPMTFIPLFEKNGFIGRLDIYMFEQACALINRWRSEGIAHIPRLSVNASNVTFTGKHFVEDLILLIERYDIDPSMMEIELTESALANSSASLMFTMNQLKDAGFHVSIDDFGSGYSSFSLLKDACADVLKIDKEFLNDTINSKKGKDIVGSIISMSKKLELETVAEGVETGEQALILRNMGCDIAQGYYYARPMAVSDFERLIATSAKA